MERIVPGLLIAGFWLLLLLFGSIQLFCFIIVPLVLVGANEYVKMADNRRMSLLVRWLLSGVLVLPVVGCCLWPGFTALMAGIVSSFLALTCYFLFCFKSISDSYDLFCRLVFGVIYIGLFSAYLVLIRYLPDGGSWLIIGSAITACSDSGAYFVGRAIGKRKLCPLISPNKTVEGAVGGIVAGTAGAVIFAILLLPSFNLLFLTGAAVLLTIAGIGGDLTESIIKRGTATKDSGRCLAGHGGVLDRVDSLLFVAPILYHFLIIPGIQ